MAGKALQAVADGTRMLLLREIRKKKGICACELPPVAKVSQPAVSQHLKVLLEAGLVEMRRVGVKRIYSLSEKGRKVMRDIEGW
ncbi:TPA: winged helix-turn-helix transcriptional regulator [Candidatus Micrarchaeota archaeon]|nr:winged helix-turn-helix transcriptional regulator [Candidatus Micrarchaeota archaeon]HIH31032.1 winged helix-turn-helix transcriptional regulator [Candidatus Micrarchaeota archaeon]